SASARTICRLDALEDPGSSAFTLGSGPWPLRGFLVRRGDDVFAYVNRCPHAGHPLNMRPHEFLTPDRAWILCNSHGAIFEIAGGRCVAGPCVGRARTAIEVVVRDGWVVLGEDPDALIARHA